MTTPTPRTDAMTMIEDARNVALEFTCKNPPPKEGENVYVVPADFARQLEQELNEARETLEVTKKAYAIVISERDEAKLWIEKSNTVQHVMQVEAERDQLKKVLDEFAIPYVQKRKTK